MITRIRDGKVCESALRHRVRNLRAKVRMLLPADVCCKHQKRSKNVLKMLQNRGQNGVQDWYVPKGSPREKYLFERLSKGEVEQIKEDKLYYMGEQFIDEFDRFVQTRYGVREWRIGTAAQSIPDIPAGPAPRFHKTASSNLSEYQNQKENQIYDRKVRNMIRHQQIQQKRKLMTEQQKTRKMFIKGKIRQRQRKRQYNFEQMLAIKERSIQERSQINQIRTSMSLRVKKSQKELGEITELSQKLRGLCLQRGLKGDIS